VAQGMVPRVGKPGGMGELLQARGAGRDSAGGEGGGPGRRGAVGRLGVGGEKAPSGVSGRGRQRPDDTQSWNGRRGARECTHRIRASRAANLRDAYAVALATCCDG
jgi:hypothetical protein